MSRPVTSNEVPRCIGRSAAIPMIGIGAACCSTIDIVQTRWPDLAAMPGAAGSACALLGVLLLFRCQLKSAQDAKARKAECIRISPYVPEMADGSSGADILKVVLAPAPQPVYMRPAERHHRPEVAPVAAPVVAAERAPKAARADNVTPFFAVRTARAARAGRTGATATLIGAKRFGPEWSRDVNLSGRALARLESDPFVKRLSRLA